MKKAIDHQERAKAGTSARATAHRRRLFIETYVRNGANGTRAAIEAGYSPKTANEQAARLLANVSLRAEIERRQRELAESYRLRTENVILELTRIVHADPVMLYDEKGKLLPIHRLPEEIRKAIASVEYDDEGQICKIKLWDKNSAIDKAMKHLGLFREDNQQKTAIIQQFLEAVSGHSRGLPRDPEPGGS